jgi:hypothetical protein
MKIHQGWQVAVALMGFTVLGPVVAQAQQQLHILLDISSAPDAGDYALKSSPLVMEWYPKINAILYGTDRPLPFNTVVVAFEPGMKVASVTSGNVIHVNSARIKVMPDDFRGMIIHELTHVVQQYPPGQNDTGWLTEGIADYIRHKYFENDIQPTLHLNNSGKLYGYRRTEPFFYGLQEAGTSLNEKGYLKSYQVTASFLFWLENHKDKQIVQDLNKKLSQGQYSPELFQQFCGQPLDDLWAAFVTDSIAR